MREYIEALKWTMKSFPKPSYKRRKALSDQFAGGMGAGFSNHFEPDPDERFQQIIGFDDGENDLWTTAPGSNKSSSNGGRKNTSQSR